MCSNVGKLRNIGTCLYKTRYKINKQINNIGYNNKLRTAEAGLSLQKDVGYYRVIQNSRPIGLYTN